jgi:hypothetical protein
MSISQQSKDFLLNIMVILDVKTLTRLGRCSQRLLELFHDENLWALKLELDFRTFKYEESNSIESYKWRIRVEAICKTRWRHEKIRVYSGIHDTIESEAALNDSFRTLFMHFGPKVLTRHESIDSFIINSNADDTCKTMMFFCYNLLELHNLELLK